MARQKKSAQKAQQAAAVQNVRAGGNVVVSFNNAHSIIFEVNGKKVKINGSNESLRGVPDGVLTVGKYGQTVVTKADWEAIKSAYGKMAIFTNGLIFAAGDHASAKSRETEQKDLRHGLEPVDTEKTYTKADTE
ncbi:MAG: hypothetical protein NC112_09000 [Oxalobacter formigenes]|nr:hypothetical protein [Oxalobacter formigenes]